MVSVPARTPPRKRRWTPDDDRQLRRLWGTIPRLAIARQLNRPLQGIDSRAILLGLPRRYHHKWTAEQDAVLRDLYPTTAPIPEIARRVGCPPSAVRLRAARLGIRRPERSAYRTPALLGKVRELTLAGRNDSQIARLLATELGAGFDLAKHRVQRIRQRLLRLPAPEVNADWVRRAVEQHRREVGSLAARYNLPANLTLLQFQILLALASGPKTVAELSDAVGRTPAGLRSAAVARGKPSALNVLLDSGLVTSMFLLRGPRPAGRPPGQYLLTSRAMDLLAAAGREVRS